MADETPKDPLEAKSLEERVKFLEEVMSYLVQDFEGLDAVRVATFSAIGGLFSLLLKRRLIQPTDEKVLMRTVEKISALMQAALAEGLPIDEFLKPSSRRSRRPRQRK